MADDHLSLILWKDTHIINSRSIQIFSKDFFKKSKKEKGKAWFSDELLASTEEGDWKFTIKQITVTIFYNPKSHTQPYKQNPNCTQILSSLSINDLRHFPIGKLVFAATDFKFEWNYK